MRTVYNHTDFPLMVELTGLPPIILNSKCVYMVPNEYVGDVRIVWPPRSGLSIMVRS